MDTSHLDTLQLHLSHERARLEAAQTDREREIRTVWVAQLEREVTREYERLKATPDDVTLSDDDLLAELGI